MSHAGSPFQNEILVPSSHHDGGHHSNLMALMDNSMPGMHTGGVGPSQGGVDNGTDVGSGHRGQDNSLDQLAEHAGGEGKEAEPAPKKRRNRKPVTCQQCRKRKLKCDRGSPCGACRDRNEAHLCSWEDAIRLPQQTAPRDQEAVELRSQLDRLESLLVMMGAGGEPPSPASGGHDLRASSGPFPFGGGANFAEPDREHERHTAAEALGMLSAHTPVTSTSGAHSQAAFDGDMQLALLGIAPNSSPAGPGKRAWGPPVAVRALPPKASLEDHVEAFVANALPWTPVFHVGTWRERYEAFKIWRESNAGDAAAGKNADPCFVALLLAMCGAAKDRGFVERTSGGAKGIDGDEYFVCAMAALHEARFMEGMSLDAVRTLLIAYNHYSKSKGSVAAGVLGMATKFAIRAGLDRDPVNLDNTDHADTQQRRRLWYQVLTADWMCGGGTGRSYACQVAQFDTRVPNHAEVWGVQTHMQDGVIRIDPTGMTYLLIDYQIAELSRKITDTAFNLKILPSYETVTKLNNDIHDLERRLGHDYGSAFALEWENCQPKMIPLGSNLSHVATTARHLKKIGSQFGIRLLSLRLNRPFLTRGLSEPTYAQGREECIAAARFILAVKRGLGAEPLAVHCWELTYHACNAILILALDLYQEPKGPNAYLHQADIGNALIFLRAVENQSPAVGETVRVVLALANRAGVSLADPSRKRKRKAGLDDELDFDSILQPQYQNFAAGSAPRNALAPLQIPLFEQLNPTDSPMSIYPTTPVAPAANSHTKKAEPFSRPLPLPMSSEPLYQQGPSLVDSQPSETSFAQLWDGLVAYPQLFYALPDRKEWIALAEKVPSVSSTTWNGPVDLDVAIGGH